MRWGSVRVAMRCLTSSIRIGRAITLGLFFFCTLSFASHVEACTLWAATGQSVDGNGTLIAKNRDWTPDHGQELLVLRPKAGYASLVLIATGGDEPGAKAGVNEKGLVIVSATASQLSREERNRAQQKHGLTKTLLAECASVADVLNRLNQFRRPVFYLVGDKNTIASIEVAPDGRVHVERRTTGTLAHTNHYLAADARGVERLPSASSTIRLKQIEQLLREQNRPFSLDAFIRLSEDKSNGPDDSIWRTGSIPKKKRTLASWIVRIPQNGTPELYLKTADPGHSERICWLSADDAFSAGRNRISLDGNLCRAKAADR